MSNHLQQTQEPVFRVDKFIVPESARAEFLGIVRNTNALLTTLDGCTQALVLEQIAGPGTFNLVTLVEWKNAAALDKAKSAVAALHSRMGVSPPEVLARLGITADMANYRQLPDGAGGQELAA